METCTKQACTSSLGGACLTSYASPADNSVSSTVLASPPSVLQHTWLRRGWVMQGVPQCAEPVPGTQHLRQVTGGRC